MVAGLAGDQWQCPRAVQFETPGTAMPVHFGILPKVEQASCKSLKSRPNQIILIPHQAPAQSQPASNEATRSERQSNSSCAVEAHSKAVHPSKTARSNRRSSKRLKHGHMDIAPHLSFRTKAIRRKTLFGTLRLSVFIDTNILLRSVQPNRPMHATATQHVTALLSNESR